MPKKSLFNKATNWGVTSDGHVAHLVEENNVKDQADFI